MTTVERRPNLGEQVYAFVRDRIVGGFYVPGQVINESGLASELSVSRTPVSTALIMLKERGLVEGRQGRLAVPRLTIGDVRDLYRCRLAFDGLATRLAAERMQPGHLDALARDMAVWDAANVEDDSQSLWVADLGFHERIYEASGNRHLVRFAQIAADLVAVYRHNTIRRLGADGASRPRSRADVRDEHRRIFDALAARDPAAAEAAARAHIECVIAHLDTLDVVTPQRGAAEPAPPSQAGSEAS